MGKSIISIRILDEIEKGTVVWCGRSLIEGESARSLLKKNDDESRTKKGELQFVSGLPEVAIWRQSGDFERLSGARILWRFATRKVAIFDFC